MSINSPINLSLRANHHTLKMKDIISVSGVAGLHKLVSSRNNGLMLEDLDSGKTKFYSVRKHQFTPLETVAIYTMMDTVELAEVFKSMTEKSSDLPIIAHNASSSEIINYFSEILPDYDRDRVYLSDIKKILKWYRKLEEKGLLVGDEEE